MEEEPGGGLLLEIPFRWTSAPISQSIGQGIRAKEARSRPAAAAAKVEFLPYSAENGAADRVVITWPLGSISGQGHRTKSGSSHLPEGCCAPNPTVHQRTT